MFISKGTLRLAKAVHEKILQEGEEVETHRDWVRITISGITIYAYYHEYYDPGGYIEQRYSTLKGPNWTVVIHAHPPYSRGDQKQMIRDLTYCKLSGELE